MSSHRTDYRTPEDRPFLLYCPTCRGDYLGEFFGAHRLFDVALNDYSGEGKGTEGAEYRFAEAGHKWPCFHRNLERITKRYEYYAVFDPDLKVSMAGLNALFVTGYALNLQLYQPGLSADSYYSFPSLLARRNSLVREVSMVEIMMPFFSAAALEKCRQTFVETESGWGCDVAWSRLLDFKGIAVVDAVQAVHTRPVTSGSWVLVNGKTPEGELREMEERYGVTLNRKTKLLGPSKCFN